MCQGSGVNLENLGRLIDHTLPPNVVIKNNHAGSITTPSPTHPPPFSPQFSVAQNQVMSPYATSPGTPSPMNANRPPQWPQRSPAGVMVNGMPQQNYPMHSPHISPNAPPSPAQQPIDRRLLGNTPPYRSPGPHRSPQEQHHMLMQVRNSVLNVI